MSPQQNLWIDIVGDMKRVMCWVRKHGPSKLHLFSPCKNAGATKTEQLAITKEHWKLIHKMSMWIGFNVSSAVGLCGFLLSMKQESECVSWVVLALVKSWRWNSQGNDKEDRFVHVQWPPLNSNPISGSQESHWTELPQLCSLLDAERIPDVESFSSA